MENYQEFNLKPYNTFKINSFGKNVYFPKNNEELTSLFKDKTPLIIGGGSNILFSSSGVEDDLIFMKNFNKIEDKGDFIYVESGVKSPLFANYALDNGLGGFEFLIPIPSTIGGNIYMNSSAHNQSISDNLISVEAYDIENKKLVKLKKEDCEFGYRKSIFNKNPNKYVILGASFKKIEKNKEEIKSLMEEILKIRKERQPSLKTPNAGSIFKNPENNSAGKLIEEIGYKGKRIGGAEVSTLHGNFIVNIDNAKSDDIVNLMYEIKEKVYNKFNIRLEPEIIYVGKKTDKVEKIWKK